MLVFEQMAEQVLGILVRESWNPADHSWYTEFFLNGNMDVQHDETGGPDKWEGQSRGAGGLGDSF